MNAFDEAIERIDEIHAPNELKPTMIKAFQYFSKYFEQHKDIKLDFNELFEKELYRQPKNPDQFNLKIELVEKIDEINGVKPAGCYIESSNTITMLNKEQFNERDIHSFMHEFIHFLFLRSYKNNLTRWANEMMTEYTTKTIHGSFYHQYGSLINSLDFINEKIEPINADMYLNCEFKSIIDKYNLENLNEALDELREEKNVKTNLTSVVKHFISIKSNEMIEENTDFEEYLNKIINLTFVNFNIDIEQIKNSLSTSIVSYMKQKYHISLSQNIKEIEDNLMPYYVQKQMEDKIGCKILEFDAIKFNSIQKHIYYGEDGGIYTLFKRRIIKLDKNNTILFTFDDKNAGYKLKDDSASSIIINDKRGEKDEMLVIKYNEETKRYEIPENCKQKHFECKNDLLMKNFKTQLELIDYKNKCRNFDSRQMRRINSFDSSIERRLKEIILISKLLNTEIYCTPPTRWLSKKDPENPLVVHSPIYNLENISEEKLKKVILLDVDSIHSLMERLTLGTQINFIIKDENGEFIPLANVIKDNDKGEFSLHTNYNAFINKIPNKYKNEIYKKNIPNSNLFKEMV